ncbi:MAG: hypothetical protein EPO30_05425 [Lysobacteraceae bacterium]|nr:MAG: hypothetical protein EPO30_05425 [Xanthomonadaceae bacterium]
MPGFRQTVVFALVAALLLMAGCASTPDRDSSLREAQYAWSAAIRWGDFEGAWNLVDPEYRAGHPLSSLELERYKQVQVSRYHEIGARTSGDRASREIGIGVVNRNTQVQREARYLEQWRYDAAADRWWITGGLPDFWAD